MKRFAFTVFGCSLLASVSLAQMPGGQPPPDPCAALAKFFNKDAEFTASAKVVVVGKKASDNQTMVMRFAVSGRKMRNEMDMTKMSGVRSSDVRNTPLVASVPSIDEKTNRLPSGRNCG